jgi:hypothetical protein
MFFTRALPALICLAGVGMTRPALATLPPAPAGVQTLVQEGIEFSVIDSPGNAPFSTALRPANFPVQGRGGVGSVFAMARTEVTTAQWLEFVNTFSVRGGSFTQFGQPIRWGARIDQSYAGPGVRWQINPNRAMAEVVPVWGINWREAAMYCNWLHNGRTSDPASLTHGAYDTATFGYPGNNFFNGFTDQPVRSPGARFWIPSLDEWIKGAFYDPRQSRWWLSHYGSDTAPVYGLPGEPGAQSNAGLEIDPLGNSYFIPLTAYGTQSPYGLLSTSGGPHELLEDAVGVADSTGLPVYRRYYSGSGISIDFPDFDLIYGAGGTLELPSVGRSNISFRIASLVPSPCSLIPLATLSYCHFRRRRY